MPLPARDNPFRTECLGQLSFDPGEGSSDQILGRLRELKCRAAIVGPHGTGKSTCLKFISQQLPAMGYWPVMVRTDGDHPHPTMWQIRQMARGLDGQTVLLLDGADHLPWVKAWLLCRLTQKAGGLIVTSHVPWHLPTLITTSGDAQILSRLIDRLTGRVIESQEVEALLQQHAGNMREVLFDLYDRAAAGRGVYGSIAEDVTQSRGKSREEKCHTEPLRHREIQIEGYRPKKSWDL